MYQPACLTSDVYTTVIFIVVTGPPRVGKTTIVMCIANKLNERGINVGSVVSRVRVYKFLYNPRNLYTVFVYIPSRSGISLP